VSHGKRPTRRFFRQDPETLARALLGQVLVRRLPNGKELSGRIVEVEAYLGIEDKAAHSYGGRRTTRNESMWLDGGHAYVYFIYGMHFCMNVVSGRAEVPTACLIRALEPVEGLHEMRRRRFRKLPAPRLKDTDLCSGPAKLTQALAIDRKLDGVDLVTSEQVFLVRGRNVLDTSVTVAPRVGIAYAKEWASKPLRFFLCGNPQVSR
jgi:DNA-3-methyladenine glycosylase